MSNEKHPDVSTPQPNVFCSPCKALRFVDAIFRSQGPSFTENLTMNIVNVCLFSEILVKGTFVRRDVETPLAELCSLSPLARILCSFGEGAGRTYGKVSPPTKYSWSQLII